MTITIKEETARKLLAQHIRMLERQHEIALRIVIDGSIADNALHEFSEARRLYKDMFGEDYGDREGEEGQ